MKQNSADTLSKHWKFLPPLILALVALASVAPAQELKTQVPVQEFIPEFNRQFQPEPPLVGTQMLDGLEAFDADGQPFDFERLKGKHTVIVFGCLT